MNIYLTVDFGSTFTKLTAIDLDNAMILATEKDRTTFDSDIIYGYNNALKNLLKKIEDKYNLKNITFKKISASSSAGGGLKIIAIGLVPTLTSEAAKKAALSSGAKVTDIYSFELNKNDIEKIINSDFDMIIISGGTDGGNKDCIINNVKLLAEYNINKPIVIAGNIEANEEILKILKNTNIEYYITENVMPVVNQLNINPVRNTIKQVFMKHIINAKGMEEFQKQIGQIVLPTPAAVLKAAELLADGINDEEGIGELMVIDIGGATTDIHTIAKGLPNKNNIILKGMEEPYSKRTVEGDLGMRHSAMSLYEATTLNKIRNYLGEKDAKIDIRESFVFRERNIDYVADNDFDIRFDDVMAKLCVELAVNRHAGVLECIFSPMGTIFNQSGKDLMNIKYVIGTGGAIINSKNPEFILESACFTDADSLSLKPMFPNYLIDKNYILASMGILSQDYPEIALKILKNELKKI